MPLCRDDGYKTKRDNSVIFWWMFVYNFDTNNFNAFFAIISAAKFADMIHCSRRTAYDIFHNDSIDIKRLQRISKLLGHDFVSMFTQNSNNEKKTFHFLFTVENGEIKIEEE